jgi:hypothetical protein
MFSDFTPEWRACPNEGINELVENCQRRFEESLLG